MSIIPKTTVTAPSLLSILSVMAATLLPSPIMASNECKFDYGIDARFAYSDGRFHVENHGETNSLAKTHNNASRVGGSLSYKCNKTTLKLIHHSVIDLFDEDTENLKKIIGTLSLSNEQYGSLIVGQLSTPYKIAGKKGDPFWDTPSGTTFAANNFGLSEMTRGFTKNTLIYKSPELGDFNFILGYSGKNSEGDLHSGIEYKHEKNTMGVQYLSFGDSPYVANSSGSENAMRIYGRYNNNAWFVSGSIETINKITSDNDTFLNISLQKEVVDFGRVAFSYGHVSDTPLKLYDKSVHEGDGHGISVGGFYNWNDNGEIYLITSLLDFGEQAEQYSIILGLSYSYKN